MLRTCGVVCVALLLCGCAHQHAPVADGRGTVTRVIDGDTIVVRIGGHDESVRLIGIDTPETQKTPLGL